MHSLLTFSIFFSLRLTYESSFYVILCDSQAIVTSSVYVVSVTNSTSSVIILLASVLLGCVCEIYTGVLNMSLVTPRKVTSDVAYVLSVQETWRRFIA